MFQSHRPRWTPQISYMTLDTYIVSKTQKTVGYIYLFFVFQKFSVVFISLIFPHFGFLLIPISYPIFMVDSLLRGEVHLTFFGKNSFYFIVYIDRSAFYHFKSTIENIGPVQPKLQFRKHSVSYLNAWEGDQRPLNNFFSKIDDFGYCIGTKKSKISLTTISVSGSPITFGTIFNQGVWR